MEETKTDETSKRPDARELQEAGQKAIRKFWKNFKATWKLYRQSKTGIAGLAIVVGFFIMALGAPWLAPYDKDFRAPATDTFVADYALLNLTEGRDWTRLLGLTDSLNRDHPLEGILAYSEEGMATVYPVTRGTSAETEEIGIEISDPLAINLPANATYMNHVLFSTTFFYIVNTTDPVAGTSTLYEYSSFIPTATASTYELLRQYELPFVPKYNSNLWNGFSFVYPSGRLALAFADDHNVWMISKRAATIYDSGSESFDYINNLTIDDSTIIGNPVVVDGDFDNGSMLFVPTDVGIRAYRLNVTKTLVTRTVTDITIEGLVWTSNYTIDGETYEPVAGNNMLIFPFPYGPTTALGKEYVALAATDGTVAAYDRVTGNLTWSTKPMLTGVRSFDITSLYSAPDFLVMVGQTNDERGMIAGLDKKTGRVGENNTVFTTVSGYLNSDPQYVAGQLMYVFSTDEGAIYLANSLMKVNATFSAPGGGAVTPVAYLGNIYIEMSRAGNYFAVVTESNQLFLETLTGVNVAPLAPGTYPSGNYYPLGTDYEGHDILTQLMWGTRAELLVGITAAFFSVVIGTIVGLVAGFYGGMLDDILMRATDVMLSLPYLVIMLLFAAVFGPSLLNIIIIFAILSWAGIARVIRSVTLSFKERAFVDAARVAGASDNRLIFKHIGPNVLPYTFLYMTFNISGAIVTEAILAFLGFGDPTNITWGMMLQFLQISGHTLDAPWWLLPPGIAITLLSLAFYLMGRSFDEVVNPRLRKR
ncbi:MAG: ABC transporter permease [Candidatus Thermoplasmatota archaeon]|nr:ABC transporter permease [Candidatus Thermoplasmatota archaeon]